MAGYANVYSKSLHTLAHPSKASMKSENAQKSECCEWMMKSDLLRNMDRNDSNIYWKPVYLLMRYIFPYYMMSCLNLSLLTHTHAHTCTCTCTSTCTNTRTHTHKHTHAHTHTPTWTHIHTQYTNAHTCIHTCAPTGCICLCWQYRLPLQHPALLPSNPHRVRDTTYKW